MRMEQKINTIKTWLGTGSINIFGLPFAGKDTQGNFLAEKLDGVIISSGDVFRHAKETNHKVQDIMAKGEIVPSEMFEEIIVPFLAHDNHTHSPLILSEVGRMEGEQLATVKACKESNHPIKAMVLVKLTDEEVFRRFEVSQQTHDRGDRADDNRQVIQTRLDAYKEKVTPVIEWYREQGLLIEVDGTPPREVVSESIINALHKKATS